MHDMARPRVITAVLVLILSPGFTWEVKGGTKFLSKLHWEDFFLNAIEAAQFLNPTYIVIRICICYSIWRVE